MSTGDAQNPLQRRDLNEALERFRQVEREARKNSFCVPPGFLQAAWLELTEDYEGPPRFQALILGRANEYIELLHENGHRIACLLEEREDRKKELRRLEEKTERENGKAERQLRREIRTRFPDAERYDQNSLLSYIKNIGVELHPDSILNKVTPPRLHGEIEEPGRWQALRRKFDPYKGQILRLRFDLDVLRMVIDERRTHTKVRKHELPERREEEQVFSGKRRSTNEKGHIHSDVQEWAVSAYNNLYFEEGMATESAKDEILSIAESYDYEFSRRSLERWIRP